MIAPPWRNEIKQILILIRTHQNDIQASPTDSERLTSWILDEFQTLLSLALFLLANRPHHQRPQGQLDSLRSPAISYYAQNSHFHPRLAVDLGTSNAHKQSTSKVYVKHLSIEGPTANPIIIHAPFMQLIRNTMQYHAISIRTKTLQQNALELYSDIELCLKQQHSKNKQH